MHLGLPQASPLVACQTSIDEHLAHKRKSKMKSKIRKRTKSKSMRMSRT